MSNPPISLPEYTLSENEYHFLKEDIDRINAEFQAKGHSFIEFIPTSTRNKYKIKTKSWVGSIQINQNTTVIVNPRFSPNSFLKMLNYVDHDLTTIFEEFSHFELEKDLLDYLIRVFLKKAQDLFEQLKWKSYSNIVERRSTIKGKIKVKENLNYNKFLNEKCFCEYSEYSMDNIFNQTIKYALHKLFYIIHDPALMNQLKLTYSFLQNVSLQSISTFEIDRFSYNRFIEAYKPVHLLSKFFIDNIYISHSFGNQDFYCFFINMYDLFEKFVRNVLRKYSRFQVLGQPTDKFRDLNNEWQIKPDIRILKDNKEVLVLDTKYKDEISDSDKDQIYNYLRGYNLNKGVLIYPKVKIKTTPFFLPDSTIYIKTIDLSQIESGYLKQFTEEIENLINL